VPFEVPGETAVRSSGARHRCLNRIANKPNAFDGFLAPDDKRLNIMYYEDRQLKQLAAMLERDKKLILKLGKD
jgi:hypothetical protein